MLREPDTRPFHCLQNVMPMLSFVLTDGNVEVEYAYVTQNVPIRYANECSVQLHTTACDAMTACLCNDTHAEQITH